MDRRNFIKQTGLACSALVISPFVSINAASEPKPNILFIMTDQQFAGAMGCVGNPYLKTPAIDSIAESGVIFKKSYCVFPLCLPSRHSMFTSRMPHESGIFANQSFPKQSVKYLSKDVAQAGYECHYVGKWHLPVAEGDKEIHGFDKVVFGGGYGGLDSDKAQKAVEFIEQQHDKPFFLVVSFNNPHDCCELARGEKLRMGTIDSPPELDLLPPLPDNFEIPENEPDILRDFQKNYSKRIFPSYNWTEQQFRQYLWGYYKLIEKVDCEIGKVLEALNNSGLADNTVIIFTSDHGDGHSRHQWNQKFSLYDESSRVPFIIAHKGKMPAGKVNEELVSSGLDLMPTICDYAGAKMPDNVLGKSLKPLAEGCHMGEWREYVVCETSLLLGDANEIKSNLQADCWPLGRMVRSDDYKYILFNSGSPREQLIDMKNDPGEMNNLVDDNKYKKVLGRHRKYLKQWCLITKDDFYKFI